jgi:nitrite reductase (cytochrome c-552)
MTLFSYGCRIDFIGAENSAGFHASREAARTLAQSIDFTRQGQVALRGLARAGN